MKALSLKLPDPLFFDLAQLAHARAKSQSEIVRSALTASLRSEAPAQAASCAERASRWIGIVDGPTDLSTNAAHLDGFGQ